MAVRPYDRERDDLEVIEHVDDILLPGPSLDEQLRDGMQHHVIRLSTALEAVLDLYDGVENAPLAFARERLDEYQSWFSEMKSAVDEQWHARFGVGS